MDPDSQSKDPCPAGVLDREDTGCHHANPVISMGRKWSRQEKKIVMESYLLNEPRVRGYRKCMLSSWLNKGMFGYQNKDYLTRQILFTGIVEDKGCHY